MPDLKIETAPEPVRTWPAEPHYLRATFQGRAIGVDRTGSGCLRGYVVAQEGVFKDRRGEFDTKALQMIADQGNAAPKGLKSRFTHPDMSGDGLGKFLGRSREYTMGTATAPGGRSVRAVRANLYFDPSAHNTPSGNLADYVMRLAESDPDALSSSLVIEPEEECRLNRDGTLECDEDGQPLPMLWRPKALHASDIVDTGDAVDGLLSAQLNTDGLPLSQLWKGAQLLDQITAGQPRDVVESRMREYLGRYLDRRYGGAPPTVPDEVVAVVQAATPKLDARRERLEEMAHQSRRALSSLIVRK